MAMNFEPHECVIFVQSKKIGTHENKHTESIAKAIQVPHRPQQIQICNSLKKVVGSWRKWTWSVAIEIEACYQLAFGYVKG